MSLETFVGILCAIPVLIYFFVYEINWSHFK